MRAKHRKSPRPSSRRPQLHLEPLEPRVLLTTIGVGDWFVYQQGDRAAALDGNLIRVDIENPSGSGVGTAEIMRWNAAINDVDNIPGLVNGADVFGGLPRPLGTVIGPQPWTNLDGIHALAIDSASNYFAIDNDTGLATNVAQLVQLNPANSMVLNLVGDIHYDLDTQLPNPTPPPAFFPWPTIYYNNIRAMDFDSNDVLWAVGSQVDLDAVNPPAALAGVHLITIDTTTGEATFQGLFLDPAVLIESIAFDAADGMWGIRGPHDLVTIRLADAGISTAVALTDAATNAPLDGMTGLDWVGGTLYGVANGNLYSINTGTGLCTLVGVTGQANFSGLANDPADTDNIYGIDKDASGDRLVRMMIHPPHPATPFAIYLSESDAYTEVRMTVVVPYVVDGVTYYDDLRLWNAATTPLIARIDNVDYFAPATSGGALLGAVPGPIQGQPDRFLPVRTEFPLATGTSALGVFPGGDLMAGLTVAETGPAGHTGDLGSLYLGGTQAGRLIVPGSVENVLEGFFFGNTDITGDLRTMIVHTLAGGMPIPAPPYFVGPTFSSITVGGTLGDLYVRGTAMYSEIYAGGFVGVPDPATTNVDWNNHRLQPLLELEGRIYETLPVAQNPGQLWGYTFNRWYGSDVYGRDELFGVFGRGAPSVTFTNNAQLQAQFLANESGNIILWGYIDTTLRGETVDWYAMPLEAGQTVRIHGYSGNVTDPRNGGTFIQELRLLGPNNQFYATFEHETVEDIGVGSKGTVQKTLTFTAPEAGLYYILVQPDPAAPVYGVRYTLFINDAAPTTLGGARFSTLYAPRYALDAPNQMDINVGRGDLGAVTTDGMALSVRAYVERGSLLDFEADQLGYNPTNPPGSRLARVTLIASDNVGRVASRLATFGGRVFAGADTGHTVNTSADIQNIWVGGGILNGINTYTDAGTRYFLGGTISASGSIGVIHSDGDISPGVPPLDPMVIQANSDQNGPPESIDFLDIGGDWGSLSGRPRLLHGLNGNVRFAHIGGDIYTETNNFSGPQNPVTITGTSVLFADDGGGVMTISPGSRTTATLVTTPTIISYLIIPVDDSVGGVLSWMTVSGPASFSSVLGGLVEVTDMVLAGTDAALDTISFRGGQVDIYNLNGSGVKQFANATPGDIVAGNLAGVTTLSTGGNLGWTRNSTGTWIPGPNARPAANAAAFGWYMGRLNGLQIGGTVSSATAGGSIGDLYFTGPVTTIVANSDRTPSATGWDGIRGTVLGAISIGSINVGDGLLDDGSADIAQAGIFCIGPVLPGADTLTGTADDQGAIGNVIISRRYELIGDVEWGLLNGSILSSGGIQRITGTNGARTTAIMGAGVPTDFRVIGTPGKTFAGPIGIVSFSGLGAEIYRAEIYGRYIGTVMTSADSDGIVETWISANLAVPGAAAIGSVQGGGPGIIDSSIASDGGWIGAVSGVGPVADLIRNAVDSTDSIKSLRARHIYGNVFTAPRIMDTIAATGNMSANTVGVGGIGKMTVTGDVLGNWFTIAGPLNAMTVGGQFYSQLVLQGPQTARLGKMTVTGPIGGRIESAGKIDSITSLTGDITADISTTPEALNGDIVLVQAARAFLGNLDSSGNLGSLITGGNVGIDPSDPVLAPDHVPTVVHVGGNFGLLSIGGKANKGVPAGPRDLYSDLIVDGNFTSVIIGGGLFGDMKVTGNVGTLAVNGDIGKLFDLDGPLPGPLVMRGNLEVRGSLSGMRIAPGSNVLADVTFGGDMAGITVTNGTISGDLTSLFGRIPSISVVGGLITGNITANLGIGAISVVGGKVGPAASITGNITSQNGGINSIKVIGGNLDGSVAARSFIGAIAVTGGSIYSGYPLNPLGPRPTIVAGSYIGSLSVSLGSLNADVTAGSYIGTLSIRTGNLTGDVNAAADITSIVMASDILGSTIRSGGKIGILSATNIGTDPLNGQNPLVSAAAGIGSFVMRGNVANATVLAGYDVGLDLLPNTADDLANNGDLGILTVVGTVTNSTLAAGIGPRPDNGLYGPLFDGADWATTPAANRVQVADGSSSILGGSVRGVVTTSLFLADTAPVRPPVGFAISTVDTGNRGYPLGPGIGGGNVVVVLTGGGAASYDNITGQIILAGTTAASRLIITNTGGAAPNILVAGQDDARLGSLFAGPGITLGNFDLDGPVGLLTTSAIAAGSTLNLFGGVTSFVNSNTAASTFNLNAGPVTSFVSAGPIAGGTFTADRIGSMTTNGAVGAGQVGLGANVTATVGGIGSLSVLGGNLTGNVTSRTTIASLVAGAARSGGVTGLGAVSGDVHVTNGDLTRFSAASNVSGDVSVDRGSVGTFAITGGSFRSFPNPANVNALRSLAGVTSFSILGGDFAGVLYTLGNLGKFTTNGAFNGRLEALSGIGTLSAASMVNATVSSGASITSIVITGDMRDSYILSGFDTSDDGGFPQDNATDDNRDDAVIDKLANAVTNPDDIVRGGDITRVTIGGNMTRSAISAAVGPGKDGFIGNNDDVIEGTGTLFSASVAGRVFGSGGAESYGFSAATAVRTVTVNRLPYFETGNVENHARIDPAGPPHINSFDVFDDSIEITFDQPIDLSSVHSLWFDGQAANIQIIASVDNVFGNVGDYLILNNVAHTISYNGAMNRLSVALNAKTFQGLNKGNNYLVTVSGTGATAITDASGEALDGEYTFQMPTGDGEPGGNFLYRFHHNDVGGSAAAALDLTHTDVVPEGTYRPILIYNEPLVYNGQIGDDPTLTGVNKKNDVDVYRVDTVQGDILYVDISALFSPATVQVWIWNGATWVGDGPDSLSGTGYYTEDATETYLISVCSSGGVGNVAIPNNTVGDATGSYWLYVELFNDGNSNFTATPLGTNFDATQTPTPLTWVGDTAKPNEIDANSRNVQVVTTPDDVDLYRLDNVPDLTKLDILVKSWSIGSELRPRVALFNADGAQITSIALPGGTRSADIGATPQAYLDTPVISAWTPDATPGPGGSATYYVAVWGPTRLDRTTGLEVSIGPFDGELPYQLTVTKTEPGQPGYVTPAWELPAPPTQNVYLNFTGGQADYIEFQFGPGTNTYVGPFSSSVFGYDMPGQTTQMIDQIVARLQTLYAGYNITFTTQRPLVGEYTELIISGDVSPEVGTWGLASQIDPLNSDPNDMAVIWAGEIADTYSEPAGDAMADISTVVGATIGHELGHLLGLNHDTNPLAILPILMEPFGSAIPDVSVFGTGALSSYLVGYQIDQLLLRVIA